MTYDFDAWALASLCQRFSSAKIIWSNVNLTYIYFKGHLFYLHNIISLLSVFFLPFFST
jgi:hypothetical protein